MHDLDGVEQLIADASTEPRGTLRVTFPVDLGSVYGGKPVPSLKLATNTHMYERMSGDMDINCGTIIDGDASVEEVGREIFETILATASGGQSRSEALGMGDDEFVPWTVGAIL